MSTISSAQSANGTTLRSYDIPKTCIAGVCTQEGPEFKMRVEYVPVPEPGPDEVLLKLNATGICFSDLHYMMHDIGMPKMSEAGVRSPGHEGVGIVVKVGANVKNFRVGDRGGVKPLWDCCGSCKLCWSDKETYCSKGLWTGRDVPGTYQQYIVSPARYTSPIPDEVDDFTAAPIMCSASTIYSSLFESRLQPGDWAVFPGGGGGVGIQGVQLAKAMGFRVIAVDTGDAKRELCLKMGAEAFVDFKTCSDVAAEVIRIADGEGANGVFVTAPAAYKTAQALVGQRIGSKVMCIGLPTVGTVTMAHDPNFFIFNNFSVVGTLVGSMHDTEKALDFAKRGLLKPIYELWPIDKIPEAVQKLKAGKVAGRCVVDFNWLSSGAGSKL